MILGIGTGSTVNEFIEALKDRKIQLAGAVSSSRADLRTLEGGAVSRSST